MLRKILYIPVILALFLSIPITAQRTDAESVKKPLGLSVIMEKMYLGERIDIVCYGDSITFGDIGGGRSSTPYPETLQKLLRDYYGNDKINVINKGENGRKSDKALEDFDSWVIGSKPDLVIIMYGINDASGLVGEPTRISEYKENLSAMVDKANANNISTLLLPPTPTFFSYEYATPEVNKKLLLYNRAVEEVSREKNTGFYDLYNSLYSLYFNGSVSNTSANTRDGVHFNDAFYQVIANDVMYHALDYLGLTNKLLERGQNSTIIPIVYSPFVDSDFTGVNNDQNNFYGTNYFVYNDGRNGKYLKLEFYMDTPGMDLTLISPKTEYGGTLKVINNGKSAGTIDFYSERLKLEEESVVLKNMDVGKYSLLFSVDNLTRGKSKYQEYLMYFSAFKISKE